MHWELIDKGFWKANNVYVDLRCTKCNAINRVHATTYRCNPEKVVCSWCDEFIPKGTKCNSDCGNIVAVKDSYKTGSHHVPHVRWWCDICKMRAEATAKNFNRGIIKCKCATDPPVVGKKYGLWKVLKINRKLSAKKRRSYATCMCIVCGDVHDVRVATLLDGTSSKCKECRKQKFIT